MDGSRGAAGARPCGLIARDAPLKHVGEHKAGEGTTGSKGGPAEPGVPRQEPAAAATRQPGELNESQRRRLSVTCEYIDRLLQDVEHILDAGRSKSPFPRYLPDIDEAEARTLEGQIAELRAQLLRALAWQQMKAREAEIPASRAVMINLDYIGIAIEELKPRYMRGSGAVPEDVVEDLNRVVDDLRAAAETMERSLLHAIETSGEAATDAEPARDRAKEIAPP